MALTIVYVAIVVLGIVIVGLSLLGLAATQQRKEVEGLPALGGHSGTFSARASVNRLAGGVAAIGVLLIVSVMLWSLTQPQQEKKPPYQVEKSDSPYELRRYEPRLLIKVTVSGSRKSALEAALQKVTDLTARANAQLSKHAGSASNTPMPERVSTVPIAFMQATGSDWTVRVAFAPDVSEDLIPSPPESSVVIETVAVRRYVAATLRRPADPTAIENLASGLRNYATRLGLKSAHDPIELIALPPLDSQISDLMLEIE